MFMRFLLAAIAISVVVSWQVVAQPDVEATAATDGDTAADVDTEAADHESGGSRDDTGAFDGDQGGSGETEPQATGDDEAARPNILLVLLDDAGFMDFGAYGSDSATPNIDQLAQSGVMFTRYYTHPLCGPTRASLMTGQDNHLVGAGTLGEVLTDDMRKLPAYSMKWDSDQKTVASRLKSAGYQTFVAGKWGIGGVGENLPHRFGFDRSYVLDATGSSNYRAKPYVPVYKEVRWFEDGERVSLPEDFYSSRNIVDKMIEYLDHADPAKPFFAYLSFQALHLPVQAPREYIDKYDGVFDRGWDVMRRERLERAIELGLVPSSTRLSPVEHNHRAWNSLTDEERKYWSRVMQASAGMMEAADAHLGRLLSRLNETGKLDDTIVVLASDNGPEYNTLGKTAPMPIRAVEQAWMAVEGWDTDFENLGQPGSLAGIGPEWATVSAAPFHLYKFNATEGGLRVPMVVSGPGIEELGFVDSRAQVVDIAPTLLDSAGVEYDPGDFAGRSLMSLLKGEKERVYGDEESFAFETSGTAAVYRGQWKITKTLEPHGDGQWHLYDISVDPGETTDISSERPKLFQEMIREYDAYADRVGVYEMPPGKSARKQLTINALKKISRNYWHLILPTVAVLILALFGLFWGLRIAIRALRASRQPSG